MAGLAGIINVACLKRQEGFTAEAVAPRIELEDPDVFMKSYQEDNVMATFLVLGEHTAAIRKHSLP